jgi:hypothetical protein
MMAKSEVRVELNALGGVRKVEGFGRAGCSTMCKVDNQYLVSQEGVLSHLHVK